MKLNVDCIRDILLLVEQAPYQEVVYLDKIKNSLKSYSSDEIEYAILKLNEAEYIDARIIHYDNGTIIRSIDDITYTGHQFLETIRDNKVWKETKSICGKVGTFALNFVSQVASGVITSLISQQFKSQ